MRDSLAKFLSAVFIICLSVLSSVLVNIYGWGLTPKSWWWIVGVGLFVTVFLRWLLDKLTDKEKIR